ncbi:MAG: hypothetical protein QOJ99_5350 [Bryobacterales bacterium]|jgi:hypothetical protein|nr:hypothetical protein [Bryobacterales bacterium]
MKRRRFIKAVAAAPAVPALLSPLSAQQPPATQQPSTVPKASPEPTPAATGRGGFGRGGSAASVPRIPLVEADEAANTVARYFSPAQFAALRKLAGILVPPMKGNLGALDTDAVEFLDFLISSSPADQQQIYKNGLDALNASAKRQFGRPFADLETAQADTILKPLLVPVAWAYDPPKDPVKHFIYQAHQDIRTATRNSLDASRAQANLGRRNFATTGLYWNPIDPV